MPILREIILQLLTMWGLQDNLLSTVTPRNLIWDTPSSWVSAKMMSVGRAAKVLLKNHVLSFLKIKW